MNHSARSFHSSRCAGGRTVATGRAIAASLALVAACFAAGPVRANPISIAGDMSFANGIKLTTSANNPLFTTYLYKNAYTSPNGGGSVDALVTLTGLTNGQIISFDDPGSPYNVPQYFQPVVSIYGRTFNSSATSTDAKFLFTFIQPGSVSDTTVIANANLSVSPTNPNQLLLNGSSSWYVPVSVSDLMWRAYDLDGYSPFGSPTASRQFVGGSDFLSGGITTYLSPYNPADPANPADQSRVAISYPTASTFRATSTIGFDVTALPGTVDFLRQSVSVELPTLSAFTATVGDSGWNSRYSYSGYFALDLTSAVAVPEPSTWVMGAGGLACGVWQAMRRRRARTERNKVA